VRIVVDLNRCQSYGQCVFAAPTVFELRGEMLEYEYAPDDSLHEQVKRAGGTCPVQAITIGRFEPGTERGAEQASLRSGNHGE
jgi:ferredoxin